MQETEAYISIKDHKDDFPNKIPCRLINPTKSNIGKISKAILDTINKNGVRSTEINQWKNTLNVLDLYANYTDKNKASFVQFDIENFYPSITSDLLYSSIQFAKEVTTVSDNDIHIIMQSRKTLLFNEKKPWVKRCGDEDFDVPMGCYDGAEVCELVGSYLLKKVSNIVDKKSIGLYRDDGLAILQNLSGPQIERKRKDIIKMFKTAGLNITIQAGLRIVNFLDVQFNLNNSTYQPYRKPGNTPVYINKKFNHPPAVLKQLPKSISKRISDISSDENIFCNSMQYTQKRLKKWF